MRLLLLAVAVTLFLLNRIFAGTKGTMASSWYYESLQIRSKLAFREGGKFPPCKVNPSTAETGTLIFFNGYYEVW